MGRNWNDKRDSTSPEKKYAILDMLLQGINKKKIAHEAGVCSTTVYKIKEQFPLFFGLPRKYGDKE